MAQAVAKPPRHSVGRTMHPKRHLLPGDTDGDVAPGIGIFSRRGLMVLPTALALLVTGLLWRYSTLVGVGVALLAAVGLDLLAVLRTPRIRVHRTIRPPVVERHEVCIATLRAVGERPLLARIALADRIGQQVRWVELEGPEVTYRIPTLRRGLIAVGPLTVNRVGLFGLALLTSEQGGVDHVRVLPRLVPVRSLPHGRRRSAVGADESAELGGTDLVGLHDYVPGDDLRRLHWATSARTGHLMVRDDADPATPHLTIVLDDVAEHYADEAGADTDFEDAVEVAFALCTAAVERRQPVHLVTLSGALHARSAHRVDADPEAGALYAALAEVTTTAEANLDARASHRMRLPRGLDAVAMVSGARASVEALGEVAARGTTGVLLLVDPGDGGISSLGAIRVLRGAGSADLARLWDRLIA